MNAKINHHLFSERSIDSGAITMPCAVIHSFSEPGTYEGAIMLGKQTMSVFRVEVDERYTAMQTTIDLASTDRAEAEKCDCNAEYASSKNFELHPNGSVVFYVSRGAGGFFVRVNGKLRAGDKKVTFDSRELKQGDIFAVSLLRPGTHTVTNAAGPKAKLLVAYPDPKKGPAVFRRAKPIDIQCTEKEFVPKEFAAEAPQGQIYRIETKGASRIKIELTKKDDGPKVDSPSSVFRWRKPPAVKSKNADSDTSRKRTGKNKRA